MYTLNFEPTVVNAKMFWTLLQIQVFEYLEITGWSYNYENTISW